MTDRKKRIRKVLTTGIVVSAVGVIYALICVYTPFRIPCMFRLVTGYKCPGCGVTGMALSILRFDFYEAFINNRAVLSMLPAGLIIGVHYIFRYIKNGEKMLSKPSRAVVITMTVILLAFGIVRNIFGW